MMVVESGSYPGRSKEWIKVKNRTHPAMTRVKDAMELQ
jgi:hypothetical protein